MIGSEKEFEAYVRLAISEHVTAKEPLIYALENKKAVDIVVCDDRAQPKLLFLEIKFHRKSHGRMGIGHAGGGGFQPEIVGRTPRYFQENLRWVLAHEDHGTDQIVFCNTDTISRYLSGGGVGAKFNNIQKKIFDNEPTLTNREFVQKVIEWIV